MSSFDLDPEGLRWATALSLPTYTAPWGLRRDLQVSPSGGNDPLPAVVALMVQGFLFYRLAGIDYPHRAPKR